MRTAVLIVMSLLCFSGCEASRKPATSDAGRVKSEQPDNTGVNVRDRESTAMTPIDQNENKKDIMVTADIRKRVVDTEMSTDAHNVKIITQDGKVTLRGPVRSAQEKKQIEDIARAVAGASQVDSHLEIEQK